MTMTQMDLLNQITRNSSLTQLQTYNEKIAKLRGFSNESIQETMLALLEEVGELARAIRYTETNMAIDTDKEQNNESIEGEVADVFVVLMTVCSKLGINLHDALIEKERKNCQRNWSQQR